MIPYFNGHLFDLPHWLPLVGDQPIYMFGLLVAIGVIVGDSIVVKEGARRGLDPQDVKFLNVRIVFGGFIMAHLVSVFFYFPETLHNLSLKQLVWRLISIWSGLSSFGGFLGAAIAFLYYTRKEKISALSYADSVALGLVVGWIFGRTGCFTAHDHPGRLTNFFLAVRYPGGSRHDLGFYELLFTIVIAVVLFRYARRPRVPGRVIGLFATMYAPVRFSLDFLRATDYARPDERYAGLTPAQWACIACLATGVWLLTRKGEVLPPSAAVPAPEPQSAAP